MIHVYQSIMSSCQGMFYNVSFTKYGASSTKSTRFPVTNEMFATFLKETAYTPVAWQNGNGNHLGQCHYIWFVWCSSKAARVAMVVKNWRMSTQGDSGNFLKHWNCSGACAMPPSIAKQPVVFAPRHFVPTDDAMTHLYIHIYIYDSII